MSTDDVTAPIAPGTSDGDARSGTKGLGAAATGRLWRLRTVVAAAVTAVALSGVGGAALAAAGSSQADRDGGRGGFGGPPGQRLGQGQGQGHVQPGQLGPPPSTR